MFHNGTCTYMYLCFCCSTVRGYLHSLWARLWAFPTVIWAAAFRYRHLTVSYTCSFGPILSLILRLLLWKLICPMQNINNSIHVHTCTCVLAIQRYMGNLSTFQAPLWFFYGAVFATLFTDIYLGGLDTFIWAYFELDLSRPMQNNINKHTCAFLDVFHRYMDTWAHFDLCFQLFPL